jgi:hypothetical protein
MMEPSGRDGEAMSEFVVVLRAQVDQARQALDEARQSGDTDQIHRHGARLLDLLERAASHGVDTTNWVPADLVSVATAAAGGGS